MGILDGKVAIVTGAGKGIGKGEAIALAKEGAAVTVTARTREDIDNTAREIEKFGGKALSVQCDVSIREQVEHVVARTAETFGGVDILVNNAEFTEFTFQPLEDWPEEHIRASFNVGTMGTWYFMITCLPYLKKNSGKVINTCSASGYGNHLKIQVAGYAMSKEAQRALTRIAAGEWGKYNINVNVISPAALTEKIEELSPNEESQRQRVIDSGIPLERLGDPELDIGRSVVFLAGPDSDYITGCTLSVDGGVAMIV